MREVVAEFERPVMLYSIGKDSSVLLRLAQKAFYPGPDSVPAAARRHHLQVPRDDRVPRPVHGGDRRAADRPHQHRGDRRRHAAVPGRHAALLRRCSRRKSLLDALEAGSFDAAFGGARRDEERSRAKERDLLAARRQGPVGSEAPAARAVAPAEQPHPARARASACSRSRTGPRSTSGSYIHVENIPVVPLYFAKEREVIVRGNSLIMLEQPFVPLLPGEKPQTRDVPDALARLLAVHRRRPLRRRHGAEDHRRADRGRATPSASCASSTTIRTARWR